MCKDNATSSELIPILSQLAAKLSSEVGKQVNAAFSTDLETMLNSCRRRLNVLIENRFLVMSSLLDPRHTTTMEKLLDKPFREYFDNFVKLIKSFQPPPVDDLIEEVEVTACDGDDSNLEDDFWGSHEQNGISDNQTMQGKQFDDQLEVRIKFSDF